MAGYMYKSKEWELRTVHDAVFHCISTRLSSLDQAPDPHSHLVTTTLGELVCVLRAPVVWTTIQRSHEPNDIDRLVTVKAVKQLVWTTIPVTTVGDDFILYVNEGNRLARRTLTEIKENALLLPHLEVLLMISLSPDTTDQRSVVKFLSGNEEVLTQEYARIEKDYSPTGLYRDLIATPAFSR